MKSPIHALLWENWRLTRIEAAQRLGLGLIGGTGAMVLSDNGATAAFWTLIVIHAIFWLSISKLNGGRFIDGYKPGFPLYLLYTRPVSTGAIVGVAMGYDAISCAALYLASAALLGFAFGQPLPLFSAAAWIVTYHLACTAIQWSTQNRVFQLIGTMVVAAPAFILLKSHLVSPLRLELSPAEYAAMALIGVVSIGVAAAGVARQRRGDAITSVPQKARSAGYPDWLITLFNFPCPTSSATGAQVWFELKSSGVPVLGLGLALGLVILLLFALSIPFEPLRPFTIFSVVISAPAVLLVLGGNAFGIRRRQGSTHFSTFEATQPYGTAQMAGLKLLVRSSCVLAALITVGVSVWSSSSLLGAWGPWLVDGKNDATLPFLQVRSALGDSFGRLPTYAYAVQVFMAFMAIAFVVAALALFNALRARYPRRLLVTVSLLLLHGLALVLLTLAVNRGLAERFLLDAVLRTTGWIALAAVVSGTAYVAWRVLAERLLAPRQAWRVALALAAFGAVWLAMQLAGGASLAAMTAAEIAWRLSPLWLLLIFTVLAPWSLGRVRHT